MIAQGNEEGNDMDHLDMLGNSLMGLHSLPPPPTTSAMSMSPMGMANIGMNPIGPTSNMMMGMNNLSNMGGMNIGGISHNPSPSSSSSSSTTLPHSSHSLSGMNPAMLGIMGLGSGGTGSASGVGMSPSSNISSQQQQQHPGHFLPPHSSMYSSASQQQQPQSPHSMLGHHQHDNVDSSGSGTGMPLHHKQQLNVVTNLEGKTQKVLMSMNVNLFKLVLGNRPSSVGMSPSLSRPCFSPEINSFFICGTEEQDPYKRNLNHLLFCSLSEDDNGAYAVNCRLTYPIADYLRDLQWVDGQHIVFAINSKLGFLRLAPDMSVDDMGIYLRKTK